jgi:hypothetical protein
MLHYSHMITCQIWSTYGIQFARIPLSKTCFTSLKLKLGECMNASLLESRLPRTMKIK